MKRLAFLVIVSVCAAFVPAAYGQLYLIQGSPTPKSSGGYSTSLLSVGTDGSIQTVSQILPGGKDRWRGMDRHLVRCSQGRAAL